MHQLLQHKADGILARTDARIKLLGALSLLVMVLSAGNVAFPLAVAGICGAICVGTGIRLRTLALRFAEPAFIAFMVILYKFFFTGHEPLFSVTAFGMTVTGYRDGLAAALAIAARILGAVAVVNALVLATPFIELLAALAWLKVPRSFVEVALFAWRYLFLIFDDARVIYGAQKNRLGYSGYRRGIRSFGTLAGTLVVKAFDSSQSITTAMVQRGYDGTVPVQRHKPFRPVEVAACMTFILVLGLLRTI